MIPPASSEPEPAESAPQIALTVNVDSILTQTQGAVVISSEVVDFMLDAMSRSDLSVKPSNQGAQYKFTTPPITADERRHNFENWLFAKAISDLMRGVRSSLEQSHVALQLMSGTVKAASNSTLDAVLAPLHEKAAKLKFGQLLQGVNAKLGEPLAFGDAFESLQQARNCFEHRNGIVGAVDAPAGGVLVLRFPRAKTFYLKDGKEVELQNGHVVDDGSGSSEVQIYFKLDIRERRFRAGQRISLSAADFNEIAFACNLFGTTLQSRILSAGGATPIAPEAGPSAA
jgi:hypothetical protein